MNGGILMIIRLDIIPNEAAAASEPSSLTSMKAFWMTSLTNKSPLTVRPENDTVVAFLEN